MLGSVRNFAVALLAVGLIQIALHASSPHSQPASRTSPQSNPVKREKHFSYLSIDMGVRFSYPAEYTLAPSPPPKALAEAAYHWVLPTAPHGPGASGPSYEYHYSIQMVNFDFTTAAFAVGYSLKGGKWTHPEIPGGHFESVKSIQGNGWKGLVATFRAGVHSTNGKDLCLAEGTRIIAGNSEGSSVLLDFFPDQGTEELRQAILRSIRFVSPKNQVGTARELFRSEKLGIEFQYPASYKLSAMKPFSPPGATSDSLPVEAAYELKPPVPPCCAGIGGYSFSYQYYIFFLKLDFLSAAKGLGFARNPQGKWVYKDVGMFHKARQISGNDWNGLRMTYYFRLYPAASTWQLEQGFSSGSGYLGASEGEKNLISAGRNLSVVLEFDPQQNDLRNAILKSLRFLKPGLKPAQARPLLHKWGHLDCNEPNAEKSAGNRHRK